MDFSQIEVGKPYIAKFAEPVRLGLMLEAEPVNEAAIEFFYAESGSLYYKCQNVATGFPVLSISVIIGKETACSLVTLGSVIESMSLLSG